MSSAQTVEHDQKLGEHSQTCFFFIKLKEMLEEVSHKKRQGTAWTLPQVKTALARTVVMDKHFPMIPGPRK